jgi:pilus assembly protein Flp/PilA
MSARIRRLARTAQDRGASAIEYGLMIAAIAAVIVTTVFTLGSFVEGAFTKTCAAISASPVEGSGDCTGAPAGGTGTPPPAPAPVAP